MADMMNLKFKSKHKPDIIERLKNDSSGVSRFKTLRILFSFSLLILGGLVAFKLGSQGSEAAPIIFFGVFFLFVFSFFGLGKATRKKAKLDFATELLEGVGAEVSPFTKSELELDLSNYDESRKAFWRGKSMYGNPKAKYSDKWLTLSMVLAEGSAVRIQLESKVKTKSGGIMREKRRLFVKFLPNPDRYDMPRVLKHLHRLEREVKGTARRCLSNPPEDLHSHADLNDGTIRVRVTQWDAEIINSEIVEILRTIVHFFDHHRMRDARL